MKFLSFCFLLVFLMRDGNQDLGKKLMTHKCLSETKTNTNLFTMIFEIYIFSGLCPCSPFWEPLIPMQFWEQIISYFQPNFSKNKTTKNNLAMKQVFVLGKI